jgi:hypothetical protein
LLLGDALVLAAATVVGFATHDTLGSAGARLLTTFLPWLAAWLLLGPALGALEEPRPGARPALWAAWGMLLAAPLAAVLRAAWLGTAVLPLFVAIMGGVTALGIFLWRWFYGGWRGRYG